MTTYTAITNASIDQDSPLTVDLMTLVRDNPIAISEGATDAPVLSAGWHPYDMVEVGDGNDGEFYSFATDGASAAIETPDFADGYEYAIVIEDYSCTINSNFQIELYFPTPAAWAVLSSTAVTAPVNLRGIYQLHFPRFASYGHGGSWIMPLSDPSSGILDTGHDGIAVSGASASKASKARVSMAAGTTDNGKLYLLRRRDFLTG